MEPGTPAADLNALLADREMADLFVEEAREHLGTIEALVLQLEHAPGDRSLIDAVYRPFHTIKGNAYSMGAQAVGDLAHTIESLLDRIRSGELTFGVTEADTILSGVDALTHAVEWLSRGIKMGAPPADIAPGSDHSADTSSVKVDTGRLDSLVDMVGELVILESMIRENTPLLSDPNEPATRQFSTLRRLLSELQRTSLSLRMRSLDATFRRIERAIRDVSRACGKPVDLIVSGEATELDRRVIEQIGDPLLHLVRNSIDHGIEEPAARAAIGKSPRGRITLNAFHKEGMVRIEVSDDGGGLDTDRIRAIAVSRGLIADNAALTDSEVQQLIFEPGFSTAEVVTDVSGRGVGMDVVRRNVEALGGRIDIRSVRGEGTTFLLTVPLTMAILRGVLVAAGDERYVLPAHVLREVVPLADCQVHIGPAGQRFIRLRGVTMPFVELPELLGGAVGIDDPRAVVLSIEIDGRRAAVRADGIFGVQEFVVKPLSQGERMRGFAGGAVLGDGRVGLILDAIGVFELMDLTERIAA